MVEKIEKEIQITVTKVRWSRMGKEPGDIMYTRKIEEIIEEEVEEEEEAQGRIKLIVLGEAGLKVNF